MKKLLKKQISVLIAVLMVLTTAVSILIPTKVSAANSYTLTLKNDGQTSHDFEIYQIFKGDLSGTTLSNIQWGSGIKDTSKATLGDAADKAKTLDSVAKAEKFAKDIQGDLSATKVTKTVAAAGTETVTLEPGYYLIKDAAATQNDKEKGVYTEYILKIVADTRAKTKLDVPTVEKKVKENSNDEWQDAADYNIGDKIPYKLTGTLPSNYAKYDKYTYKFHDEMSAGLTLDKESIKVKIDGQVIDKTKYTVDVDTTNNSFVVAFENLKNITSPEITKNSSIVVEYECTLNDKAVIGSQGNPNTVYLEYSNNPNKSGDGEYGTTPKDKNIVFTYKVIVNKKNEDNAALKGAEFELYKKTDTEETKIARFTIEDIMAANGSTFTFKGLDAGKYVLKETKTPEGYNTIKPIEFTIVATYDTISDNPQLTVLKALGTLTFTPSVSDGSLSTDVINKKGFILPETGGMGRYLIYVTGGLLVLLSLGYMSRKRSSENNIK